MKNSKNLSLFGRTGKLQRLFLIALFSVLAIGAYAQSKTVSGTVVDQTGEPIIGANVVVKGTTNGIITDLDGRFTLSNVPDKGTISISFIGYQDQEISVAGKTNLQVILQEDNAMLDEVVVVGYGRQKKESVVGAISSLDVGELNIPGSNISNVLAGQLAGVVSMQASGEPGKNSASDFYIRGIASFKGNSTPLVLVDGIERELDLVDVDDIATFSILKDASASAVYGVRGANGVILITTKKGSEGKPRINVRAEMGFKTPTRMPQMANSVQWAEMYNEAKGLTGNGDGGYSSEAIQKYSDGSDPDLYPNVNWLDQMLSLIHI